MRKGKGGGMEARRGESRVDGSSSGGEGGGKQGEKGGEGMKGGKQCFIENGWTNSV